MYHFVASILFYDIAQLRFPPKAIWWVGPAGGLNGFRRRLASQD